MLDRARIHLISADPILGRVLDRVGPCRLRVDRQREPFAALVKSVTYQQLNGRAAETIFNRLLALFPGKPFPTPRDLLDAAPERLRSAGLSNGKMLAIKDIAAKTVEGVVPTRREASLLPDQELIERLTTIRGVGPWTVEMLLIFSLGRRDVLPVTDFGVRKGFAVAFGRDELPNPKDLMSHGETWRPFRSVAAWYLWRAADLASGGIGNPKAEARNPKEIRNPITDRVV